MPLPPPTFTVDDSQLARLLADAPDLDLGANGQLVRRPDDAPRDDQRPRIHYEWTCPDRIRYNVLAGPGAASDYQRTRAFHDAFPDLGIRPAALLPLPGGHACVLEHFDGEPLEAALAANRLPLPDAIALLDRVLAHLDATARPPTPDDVRRELDSIRDDIYACPVWGTLDLHLFDDHVFPALRAACDPSILRLRWSNGDFIARNLLVDAAGDVRLIDCEFAALTAFAPADAFRFAEFSAVPDELLRRVRRHVPGNPLWWDLHFCVDQARKLGATRSPREFALHAGNLLRRAWRTHQSLAPPPHTSRLLDFLDDLDHLAQHSRSLQSRYDELAAHDRDLQTQFDDIQTQFGSLHAKYDSLQTHAQDLQTHCDALAQHADGLQRAYEALDAHAKSVEAARDALAAQLAQALAEHAQFLHRLKRPWLWFAPRNPPP
jgi:prefoldin subunit 5